MTSTDIFELFVEHWRDSGVLVRAPAAENEIRQTFEELQFPCSEDIRRLYSLADGFEDVDWETAFWWWPLERVREQNRDSDRDPEFVWFSDFLIDTHRYCVHRVNPEISAVYIDYVAIARYESPMTRIKRGLAPFLGIQQVPQTPYEQSSLRRQVTESISEFLELFLRDREQFEIL